MTEAHWHHGALKSGEAFVGTSLLQQLQIGDIDSAPAISLNGRNFTVAGVITDSPRLPLLSGEVLISTDGSESVGTPQAVTALAITAAGASQQVAKQLASALDPFQASEITINAPTDSATLRGQVEGGVQATLTAFTLLALVVAIAALMNATLLAVHARRGEIGMRKALGARDRHIGALITTESAYIGLAGGIVGLFIGLIAILTVTITQRWSPVFDLTLMPLSVLVGLVVGAGGGGLASIRAAKLRPADNLRS